MLFAKIVLVAAILIAAFFGIYMRVRAWNRKRVARKRAWQAALEKDLRRSRPTR